MITKTAIGITAVLGLGYLIKPKITPKYFNNKIILNEKIPLTHDVNLYKFDISSLSNEIPYGSALIVKAPNGQIRPFTVINNDEPFIQFAIKNYNRSASGSISKMEPGDSIKVFGPLPSMKLNTSVHDQVYLIGAGAGITPLWSFTRGILNDKDSNTKIKLIYCNKSNDDIILKEEIKNLEKKFPERFKFINVLESNEASNYSNTRISRNILDKEISINKAQNAKILVCGPPKFVEFIAGKKVGPPFYQGSYGGVLKEIGFKNDQVIKY